MTVKPETLLDPGVDAAWDDTAMSVTNKRVTEWLDLGPGIKDVSWVLDWLNTATVVGAFSIEVTNDIASGDFPALPSGSVILPTVNDNAGPGLAEATTRARYARLAYTNASGTGTLGSAKAFGKRQ